MSGKRAVGYLLPIGPDKLSDGCSSIFSRKYDCAEKKNSRTKKKNSRSKKNSRNSNHLSGNRAVGYLLPIGPDKLPDGCSSIFSRKYGRAEKKTQESRKKTQDLKKTQESQIAVGYLLPIGPDKLPDENIDLQPSGSLSGPIGSK